MAFSPWRPLTPETIEEAPLENGVYMFRQGEKIIYIRLAEVRRGIRGRLRIHWMMEEDRRLITAIQNGVEVCWEASDQPASLEARLLTQYRNTHGSLPQCNTRPG